MKNSAARDFAEILIRERLQELASAAKSSAPAATGEEEAQNWEELG